MFKGHQVSKEDTGRRPGGKVTELRCYIYREREVFAVLA